MAEAEPRVPDFTQVDQDDASAAVRCLEAVARAVERAKAVSIDLLELAPGHNVLEVGCGTGQDACVIHARVSPEGRVVGVDLSRDLIERARTNAVEVGLPSTSLTFQVA